MNGKNLGLFVLIVLVLVALGALAPLWLPVLLNFAGANNEVIGGLSGLVQLALWAIAALLFLFGLLRHRRSDQPQRSPERNTSDAKVSDDRRIIIRGNANSANVISGDNNRVTTNRDQQDAERRWWWRVLGF